jgi:uncharacterized protein (TIGR02147 family)
MNAGPKPDLYRYLSYRDWLRDWAAAQKEVDRRFSARLFARRAGVRSPSLLKEVIDGKRNLTPATLEGFVAACRLTHEEAGFFADLVAFDQAEGDEDRNEAWERIAARRRFQEARPLEGAMVAYLSNWFIPATRELALRPDFEADPDWVSARLRPKIRTTQARQALDTLITLGMLAEDEAGALRPVDVSVSTPHEVAGLAAHNYHRQMLTRVAEAIETVDPEHRHLAGATVAIPVDLVPRLKEELGNAARRLMHLCDEQVDRAEQVYQLHLSIVPLSTRPDEEV